MRERYKPRPSGDTLERLELLVGRMEDLGVQAEDAAARLTGALSRLPPATSNPDHQQLVGAIGDVIEIVTERSRLAHEAHRLITELRKGAHPPTEL